MERILWQIRQFQPDRKTLEILAVITMLVTAVLFYGFKGDRETITIENSKVGIGETASEENEQQSGKGPSGEDLYVDVDGAVKKPGVYVLKEGSRAFEAIKKAGGLKKTADTSGLNLAEPLKDGQKLMVPQKERGGNVALSNTGGNQAQGGSSGTRININSASSEELQTINGIGPATAQKIIDYRSNNGGFKAPEDLKNVSGIGEKTFEKMRPYVTV